MFSIKKNVQPPATNLMPLLLVGVVAVVVLWGLAENLIELGSLIATVQVLAKTLVLKTVWSTVPESENVSVPVTVRMTVPVLVGILGMLVVLGMLGTLGK